MVEYRNHEMKHIMTDILNVRYTNLEEEERLCQELLAWSVSHEDLYGQIFALTYLGDYYLAVCQEEKAGQTLLEAKLLLTDEQGGNHLRLRLYGFLGIYYDMRANEQIAMEYYLKAMTAAEQVQDIEGECVVLNNLAFLLQRYGCYEEALGYYLKAHDLQRNLNIDPNKAFVLANLSEAYLMLHEYDKARECMEACEAAETDPKQKRVFHSRNWCIYYAMTGDATQASTFADEVLEYQELINQDRLAAFGTYAALCRCMMDIGDERHAKSFLDAMEGIYGGEGLDRMKELEEIRIRYSILFETGQERRIAYKRFYSKNQLFHKKMTEGITEAMESQIYLNQLMNQTKQMHAKHKNLEAEANHDELTKIYNRKFLEGMLRQSVESQDGMSQGIIIMDVDYFKEYNDYYGHIKGDVVLQTIAKYLKDHCKKGIYPCRYGGDEFVCVCKHNSLEEIEDYIENVRASLHNEPLPHEKSPCCQEVTLSIGYVIAENGAQKDAHRLFQLADQALYESKRSGRNTYTRNRENP